MKQKSNIDLVVVPIDQVQRQIYIIRGQKVMLDADLAALSGVEKKVFNEAVQRNAVRFPEEFMFPLSTEDLNNLRSQFVISNPSAKIDLRRGHYAFTEQGVTTLAATLNSEHVVFPPNLPQRQIGFGAGDKDGAED
jgi:hypothetical protein